MEFPDLEHLVRPRSVAVVGASTNQDKGPGRIIPMLDRAGFAGAVYPVNPRYQEVAGRHCYGSVAELPGPVDLVVVMVPAAAAVDAVHASAKASAPFAVVLSSGFREVGGDGVRLQDELAGIAAEYGIRIYGPNCPGLLMISDRMAISFSPRLAMDRWKSGKTALITQGGAMGRAVLDAMETSGSPGFSYWLSPGNEVDLQAADLLGWLADDEATRAVLLVLESFRDGPRFLAAADRCRRAGKPVVVLKVGRSAEGVRATATHTAALAGADRVVDAALAQVGAVRVDDIDELVDLARVIERYGLRPIEGVGVCTLSGGSAALLADMCGSAGIAVPRPAEPTVGELTRLLPPLAEVGNPVDLTTEIFAQPALAGQALAVFLADPAIDCLLFPFPYRLGRINTVMAEQIVRIAATVDKPIVAIGMSEAFHEEDAAQILAEGRVPVIGSAARATKAIRRYQSLQAAHARGNPVVDVRPGMDTRPGLDGCRGPLADDESEAILAEAGIPFAAGGLARSAGEAVGLAGDIGYPVALKAVANGVTHKTDAGLVLLGLGSGREVRDGYRELERRAGGLRGVRVAQLVNDGIEVLCGVTVDPSFGPVVTCGFGGIYAELLDDMAMRIAPINGDIASDMVNELRGSGLLTGARGQEPRDVTALADILVRLGAFADAHRHRLREVDLNPVAVRTSGAVALDALVVLDDGPAPTTAGLESTEHRQEERVQ